MPDLRERARRRIRAIQRFCKDQRVARHWISLAALVDWCAAVTTTAGIPEQKKARDLALELLAASIRNDEFEGEQRRGDDGSKILYLAPYVPGDDAPPRCRLKREWFEYMYEANPPLPPEMLAQLWVPCDLARQWLEKHGYRSSTFPGEFPQSTKRDQSIPPGAGRSERSPTTREARTADTQSGEVERPPGVSNGAWQIYLDAKRLKPDFDKIRGGIAEAARLIEAERGNKKPWQSIYRDLMRVQKALRDMKKMKPA